MDAELGEFLSLDIDEKVKRRKAIRGLRYDSSFKKKDGIYTLCRFFIDKNQSELNVEDSILVNGSEATLCDFDEDGNVIVAFLGYDWFSVADENVIEKNYRNFLSPSYSRFPAALPDEDDKFWTSGILPSQKELI